MMLIYLVYAKLYIATSTSNISIKAMVKMSVTVTAQFEILALKFDILFN